MKAQNKRISNTVAKNLLLFYLSVFGISVFFGIKIIKRKTVSDNSVQKHSKPKTVFLRIYQTFIFFWAV